MKAWLRQWRISIALDTGKALPTKAEPLNAQPGEVGQFARRVQVLDRALKQGRPQVAVPPALHASIMRRVQASQPQAAAPAGRLRWWLWVPAPALSILALLGLGWLLQQGALPPQAPVLAPNSPTLNSQLSTPNRPSVSLATAATALQVGEQVNQAVSGTAMITPLSEELERLHRDLNETAEFLWASLP